MTKSVDAAASAASAVEAAIAAAAAAASAGTPSTMSQQSGSSGALLAGIALFGVLATVGMAAYVILKSSDEVSLEVRKIRFAAATFTGILILFVFTAILYFADRGSTGKDIFEKAVTAMTPLAGVIVGYLFGTRQSTPPAAPREVTANASDGGGGNGGGGNGGEGSGGGGSGGGGSGGGSGTSSGSVG